MQNQKFELFPKYEILLFIFLTLLLIALSPPPASALTSKNPEDICDQAALHVSETTSVPLSVLLAITRVETGRGGGTALRPWPWTVNMEGKGRWFDTEDQARKYVFRYFKNGARSFDIGCFQINYRWHHRGFNSIEEMFDPNLNAQYAAQFLSQLYTELGTWDRAVGAYHSRTNKYAKRYLARYTTIKENLPSSHEVSKTSQSNTSVSLRNRGSLAILERSSARSILGKGRN